jgi:hypothetical protein
MLHSHGLQNVVRDSIASLAGLPISFLPPIPFPLVYMRRDIHREHGEQEPAGKVFYISKLFRTARELRDVVDDREGNDDADHIRPRRKPLHK